MAIRLDRLCRLFSRVALRSSAAAHPALVRSVWSSAAQQTHTCTIFAPTFSQHIRHKFDKRSRKKNAQNDEDDEQEDILADFEDLQGGKDNKLAKIKVSSLRTDLIIKSGLGLARNKVEAAFYDSKIRINGKKVPKKSLPIHIGDEIDVIREASPLNSDHIIVARLEVLSVHPNVEDITVVLRRFKTLTIENYEGENVWRHNNAD